ncbi:MAG: UxaA family hydrolase, partial [Desulfobacterales bacterium]|nr:UxaA family hydrolase [Desulfobacterales bacterium]
MKDLKTVMIRGYGREDGTTGIRNHLVVAATVFCANHIVDRIAAQVPGTVPITHNAGCGQLGTDAENTRDIILKTGCHPNVGGILYVGLGCEQHGAAALADQVAATGKPAAALDIQACGGTTRTIEKGISACKDLYGRMAGLGRRVDVPATGLIIALECGGSDATSGLAANPAVGVFTDRMIDAGGTVVFGETCELTGAEAVIRNRTCDPLVQDRIISRIHRTEASANAMGVDMRGSQPSPGNIAGGLSTIEEKSLGAVCKSGNRPITGFLAYGEAISRKGLNFMDCPGQDLTSLCGMISGGAHLALFTTGRGTPLGYA